MEEIEKPITNGEEEIENAERKDQDFGHFENAIKEVEKEKTGGMVEYGTSIQRQAKFEKAE